MTRGPCHGVEVSLGGLGAPLTRPKAGLPVLAPPGRDFLFFSWRSGSSLDPGLGGKGSERRSRPPTFTLPRLRRACSRSSPLRARVASSLTGVGGFASIPHALGTCPFLTASWSQFPQSSSPPYLSSLHTPSKEASRLASPPLLQRTCPTP